MSLGPVIRVVYHVPGVDRRRQVIVTGNGCATGGNHARELGIILRGNEHIRRLQIRPEVPVIVDEVVAVMKVAIEDADSIYLNGYNSWTDSVERNVMDRMWGLTRSPQALVAAHGLDASGDYRFVEEDARPGHQHGFGYGYLRQGDEVLLFGSLDEQNGFTLIREDAEAGTLTFSKEPPERIIEPGECYELISLAVEGGSIEHAVGVWLKHSGITPLAAPPLVGYCSWYRHYGDIDSKKLLHDLEGCSHVLSDVNTAGLDCAFQIDDGYCKVGDWLYCDRAKFPNGVEAIAREVSKRDLTPGLWLAPFVCERESKLFSEHPEWLLYDSRGNMVKAGGNWSGAYALDIRNDEVRRYVGDVLATVTTTWGFKLLKLDFLYAACMEPHDGMNRGELMADAIDLLRSSVSDDVRLLFCGVPLMSAFGKCEYCRVGQDVGPDWDDKPHARVLHRERVSTKLSLANARGRAHLDGRAFRCDPDVMYLREEGISLSASQRVEMFVTDTSCGGVLFTSDDMGAWNEAQRIKYGEAIDCFRGHSGL